VIGYEGFGQIKTFDAFDDRYTATLHGFTDAKVFYARGSCKLFLSAIQVPVLIVNAANGSFSYCPLLSGRDSEESFLRLPCNTKTRWACWLFFMAWNTELDGATRA